MSAGRVAACDYTGCISVSVCIPEELHKELKVYCVKNGITMKEVLYNSNIKSIQDVLRSE